MKRILFQAKSAAVQLRLNWEARFVGTWKPGRQAQLERCPRRNERHFLAMQYEQPEDFILASGKLHSIAVMLNTAFGLFTGFSVICQS